MSCVFEISNADSGDSKWNKHRQAFPNSTHPHQTLMCAQLTDRKAPPLCTTKFIAFARVHDKLQSMNCDLLGFSITRSCDTRILDTRLQGHCVSTQNKSGS